MFLHFIWFKHPSKTKTIQLPLPNRVVNIGQDGQWNVNKHRICKLCTTGCLFLEIFDFDYEVKMVKYIYDFYKLHGIGYG
jgi:hypothetical protein